jgi:hypothetical protein
MECIRDPGMITDKKLKRQVLKYTSLDDALNQRTIDDTLPKCLSEEQAKEAVREVYDGICGADQSTHKMKWLLRRVGFYCIGRLWWMIVSSIKMGARHVNSSGTYN